MDSIGVFPFGQPIFPLVQKDQSKKRIFVLGVYASAVHARWVGKDGRQKIGALAVATEPEIFWRGSQEAAEEIICKIKIPDGAGRLMPVGQQLNGPSGKALDELFLRPLGFTRKDAWLCDLVPHSCMNPKQELALKREYDPFQKALRLPAYHWPQLPEELADEDRRLALEAELVKSGAELVVTLGDQPLKWFTSHYGTASKLSAYGQTSAEYGQLHSFKVAGRTIRLLPLVHPRQAARLGTHSLLWAELHEGWVKSR